MLSTLMGIIILPTLVVFLLFPSRGARPLDRTLHGTFFTSCAFVKALRWLITVYNIYIWSTIYIYIHTYIHNSICIYIMYIHMWANYNDLTATSLE